MNFFGRNPSLEKLKMLRKVVTQRNKLPQLKKQMFLKAKLGGEENHDASKNRYFILSDFMKKIAHQQAKMNYKLKEKNFIIIMNITYENSVLHV